MANRVPDAPPMIENFPRLIRELDATGNFAVVVLLASVAALAVSLLHPMSGTLDRRVFSAINRRRLPQPLEHGVRLVSHLGLMPVQGLLWVAAAMWLRLDLVGLVLAGLIAVWTLCRLVKRKVGRTRPHVALSDARLVGRVPGGSSFPSSHAALSVYSATMATLLGFSAAAPLWLVAGAVAYARVYLGVHYPRDILGGAALGAAGAVAALLLLGRFIFT